MEPKYKVGDLVKLKGTVNILGMIIEIIGNDFDFPIKYLNKFDLEVNVKTGLSRQILWNILYSYRPTFMERLQVP